MKTPLDDLGERHWFLDEWNYSDFDLELVLAKGSPAEESDPNGPVPNCHKVEKTENSRRFSIKFYNIYSVQMVDENHLLSAANEESAGGVVSIVGKSALLDYANKNFLHFPSEEYKHYRVCTEFELFEILTANPPVIEELAPNQALKRTG